MTTPKLKGSEPQKIEKPQGSFVDGGSFWSNARFPTDYHHRLIDLGKRLRRENITPRYAVELVKSFDGFIADDATLAQWEKLETVELWPCAHTGSPAAEFLKRCGCR